MGSGKGVRPNRRWTRVHADRGRPGSGPDLMALLEDVYDHVLENVDDHEYVRENEVVHLRVREHQMPGFTRTWR